jgi:hypothetical protein
MWLIINTFRVIVDVVFKKKSKYKKKINILENDVVFKKKSKYKKKINILENEDKSSSLRNMQLKRKDLAINIEKS